MLQGVDDETRRRARSDVDDWVAGSGGLILLGLTVALAVALVVVLLGV